MKTSKIKIAYVCVHNSCRSQIAEALTKHKYPEMFEVYSAGTEVVPNINQDANRIVHQLYDIHMSETQHSKLIQDIPPVDVVITMGCNVECPMLPCKYREDWGLNDPSGKMDEEFIKVINLIDAHIDTLKQRILMDELI